MLRVALIFAALVAASPAFAKDADKAEPKQAVAVISPEIEAVSIFGRACVQTGGDLDEIAKQFGALEKEGTARKLSAGDAQKAIGAEVQNAWIMQSPISKQKLLASEGKDGSCNLYIHRGDGLAVREELKRLAVWLAVEKKSKLGAKTSQKTVEGKKVDFDYYEVLTQDKSKRPMILFSGTEKPVSDTQFILTYKTITSKIDAPKE